MAKAVLAKAGDKLVLPVDTVVTDVFDFDARKVGTLKTVAWDKIGPKDIGVDIARRPGEVRDIVKGAKTVVWNGPMGVFEIPETAKGTLAIAQALADATARGAITVVGAATRSRDREERPRRQGHPRLDRRRRFPRVPRGQGAARRDIPEREIACVASSSPATGRCTRRPPSRGARRGDQEGRRGRTERHARGPPYTSLVAVVAAAKGSSVAVAAQNMHFEKEGAFTGEVSAGMLKDVGVTHAILGHSERRQYFAETDAGVAKEDEGGARQRPHPDLVRRRDARRARAGRTMEVVGRQVDAILNAVTADEAKKVVIAYEPVWAIGTGKVATRSRRRRFTPSSHADRGEAREGRGRRPPRPLRRQREADNVKG